MAPEGVVTNGTERSMYRALHQNVDEFRHDYAFIDRRTRYARAAIERWLNAGILETAEVPWSANTSMTWTAYRLAEAYRDPELIDSDLAAREQRLRSARAAAAKGDQHSITVLHDAWREFRAATDGMDEISDCDLERLRDVTWSLSRAIMRREGAIAETARVDDEARALERDQHTWASNPAPAAVGGGDPLGGDA